MITTILIIGFIFSTFFSILYYSKYKKIFKKILNFDNLLEEYNSPLRKGYYKTTVTQTDIVGKSYTGNVVIFISEIDRYKSGECKIKLDDIQIHSTDFKFDNSSCIDFINKSFLSIKKISDINWLESEEDIKQIRRDKLDKIKESIK